MKQLDFIEIGTSNFGTLIQECSEEQKGISIEPCLHYLDQLPNKKNVTKIRAAITHKRSSDVVLLYYIPEKTVEDNSLQHWFKGCNSINDYHPLHKKHKVEHLVKIEKVPLKNFEEIMIEYEVEKVNYIKIDTEGHDCTIMEGIYDFYKNKDKKLFPNMIKFETNANSTIEQIMKTVSSFDKLGYDATKEGDDTILHLRKGNKL